MPRVIGRVSPGNYDTILHNCVYLISLVLLFTPLISETANNIMATSTRVLIIDDDPDYTDVLNYQLRQYSDRYQVDSVATFEAGLRAIRTGDHDVYLVDYQLDHGQTGDMLVDEAANNMLPIVMLTGVEDDELGDRVIGAGACDFVLKRHVTGELVDRVIRNALGRRQRMRRVFQRQQELKLQISRDPLTGLMSRSFLKEEVNKMLKVIPHQGALLYLDLDGFKSVNDLYGHGTGDTVLQMAAARLIECVQPNDIVGRIGGDEFVIYLKLDSDDRSLTGTTKAVANKLCANIARPYIISSGTGDTSPAITLGLSVGIALTSTSGIEYEELVAMADRAMYRAKKNGKNGFAYD